MKIRVKGFTLIELIVSLVIMGLVIQMGFSLLNTGNTFFDYSTSRGLAQEGARLVSSVISGELEYISSLGDSVADYRTNFYSLEFDTVNQVIHRKHYLLDDATGLLNATVLQSWPATCNALRLDNVTPGMLSISIAQTESVGARQADYSMDYNLQLVNAPTLQSNLVFDLTQLGADGQPVKLFYMLSKDELTNITIDLTDLSSGTPGGGATTSKISYSANGGSGTVPTMATGVVGSNHIVASGSSLLRSGFTFDYWNTKADGTGISYAAGSNLAFPATDITLYAIWKNNSVVLQDVTIGNITRIDSTLYNAAQANYTVQKGTTSKIRVAISNFTDDHNGKVSFLINGASQSVTLGGTGISDRYIEFSVSFPSGNGKSYPVSIKSTTQGYTEKSKTFNFTTGK